MSLLLLLDADKAKSAHANTTAAGKEESPVVTTHEIQIGDKTLRYNVTTGMMPILSETGEKEADVFFMAYTKEDAGEVSRRPLMFSFNGGPGSASVWLHLGALGPKRVKMLDDGSLPPPPYHWSTTRKRGWITPTSSLLTR